MQPVAAHLIGGRFEPVLAEIAPGDEGGPFVLGEIFGLEGAAPSGAPPVLEPPVEGEILPRIELVADRRSRPLPFVPIDRIAENRLAEFLQVDFEGGEPEEGNLEEAEADFFRLKKPLFHHVDPPCVKVPGAFLIFAGGDRGVLHFVAAVGLQLDLVPADEPHRRKGLPVVDGAALFDEIVFEFAPDKDSPFVLDHQFSFGLYSVDFLPLFLPLDVLDVPRLNADLLVFDHASLIGVEDPVLVGGIAEIDDHLFSKERRGK